MLDSSYFSMELKNNTIWEKGCISVMWKNLDFSHRNSIMTRLETRLHRKMHKWIFWFLNLDSKYFYLHKKLCKNWFFAHCLKLKTDKYKFIVNLPMPSQYLKNFFQNRKLEFWRKFSLKMRFLLKIWRKNKFANKMV